MINALISGTAAFIVAVILGLPIVFYLRRAKAGKSISEDQPASHQVKAGTPTFGGFVIWVPTLLITASGLSVQWWDHRSILLPVGMIVVTGAAGFFDDLGTLQVRRVRGGLSWRFKLIFLSVVSVVAAWVLYDYVEVQSINIPWQGSYELGPWYLLIAVVDDRGDDERGRRERWPRWIGGRHHAHRLRRLRGDRIHPGAGFRRCLRLIIAGANLGFLWYNAHPAQVIMGDTGALALGSGLCGGGADDGAMAAAAADRDHLRGRGSQQHHPDWLLQVQRRQAGLPAGPDPPPFRRDWLGRNAGGHPVLGDFHRRGDAWRGPGAGGALVMPAPAELGGKRVLVYSMGIEGRDLATWLLAKDAEVVMSDTRSEAQLAAAGAAAPEGVSETHTGGPLLAAEGFDLLAVSQSVLRHSPELVAAKAAGIPVVSQMQLFLELCRGRICGISGSSGKSTTTALVGAMAKAAGITYTLAATSATALLGQAEAIPTDEWVILEISHTQLQYVTRSPNVAALTNVTPNHLDQFSWDEYVGLKRTLVAGQAADDIAVLNADDEMSRGFAADTKARVTWFGRCDTPRHDGAFLSGGTITVRREGEIAGAIPVSAMRLRGDHNVANVLTACATAAAMGLPVEAMERAIEAFTGVAHRLQVVGRANGATWVDDSIATSPERTIAGIRAFSEPVVLLLGGREKNLPLEGLKTEIERRARAIVCFGEAGPLFHRALTGAAPTSLLVGTLAEAVEAAADLVREGDAVLLSPAGTSFDAYPNFEARGRAFAELVAALPGFEPEVTP